MVAERVQRGTTSSSFTHHLSTFANLFTTLFHQHHSTFEMGEISKEQIIWIPRAAGSSRQQPRSLRTPPPARLKSRPRSSLLFLLPLRYGPTGSLNTHLSHYWSRIPLARLLAPAHRHKGVEGGSKEVHSATHVIRISLTFTSWKGVQGSCFHLDKNDKARMSGRVSWMSLLAKWTEGESFTCSLTSLRAHAPLQPLVRDTTLKTLESSLEEYSGWS